MIKYPRYEPDICHCDLIKEELGGEFSQCILDPPKESSGLLRPISTSSYVLFIFLKKFLFLHGIWILKKNKDLQRILVTLFCTLRHSLYYVSLYCQWYELMLTFLFNFDHLANNLRIHIKCLFKRLAQDFEEDSMMFSLIWWFKYPRNINKISKWDINLHVF